LVTADKSTVFAKSFFDVIMVQDGERNSRFPDPPGADESDRFKVLSESDYLHNQIIASETVPRWRGRRFTRRDAREK
jgi:hypothetical protein